MPSDTPQPPRPRQSLRIDLDAEVAVRRPSFPTYQVKISDLSQEGCKFEFVDRPLLGERLWVTLEGLQSIEGSIRWIEAPYAGVQFDRPLHPAVFDMLSQRMRRR